MEDREGRSCGSTPMRCSRPTPEENADRLIEPSSGQLRRTGKRWGYSCWTFCRRNTPRGCGMPSCRLDIPATGANADAYLHRQA